MLHTASLRDIRAGRATDVYFSRTVEALRQKAADKRVAAEVTASSLPEASLLCHHEPALRIAGNYTDFAVYETAVLGLLCQASGTMPHALVLVAGDLSQALYRGMTRLLMTRCPALP